MSTYLTARKFSDAYEDVKTEFYSHYGLVDVTGTYCLDHDIKREFLDNIMKIDRVVKNKITRQIYFIQERVRKDSFDTITIRDTECEAIERDKIYILTLKILADDIHIIFSSPDVVHYIHHDKTKFIHNKERKLDSSFYAIPLSILPYDDIIIISYNQIKSGA